MEREDEMGRNETKWDEIGRNGAKWEEMEEMGGRRKGEVDPYRSELEAKEPAEFRSS
jgi:hypothetical protein